jgi:hypothetical protein
MSKHRQPLFYRIHQVGISSYKHLHSGSVGISNYKLTIKYMRTISEHVRVTVTATYHPTHGNTVSESYVNCLTLNFFLATHQLPDGEDLQLF